jgi:hypothetical protein
MREWWIQQTIGVLAEGLDKWRSTVLSMQVKGRRDHPYKVAFGYQDELQFVHKELT